MSLLSQRLKMYINKRFGDIKSNSKHSLRLPSWRMMLARLILVTHSSSLRMLEGMVWRHKCRGSMFLVTRGIVGCCGRGGPNPEREKKREKGGYMTANNTQGR